MESCAEENGTEREKQNGSTKRKENQREKKKGKALYLFFFIKVPEEEKGIKLRT